MMFNANQLNIKGLNCKKKIIKKNPNKQLMSTCVNLSNSQLGSRNQNILIKKLK
jgi:hypothetical protein